MPPDPPQDETALEESDSWVEVLPPEFEENDKIYFLIWGRFWATLEDLTAAFYVLFSPDDIELDTFRVAIFGDYTGLQNYDPRLEHENFESRLMSYSISDAPVPQITLNETKKAIENYLKMEDRQEALEEVLTQENQANFKLWCENLFNNLVDQGTTEFHVRGRAVNRNFLKGEKSEVSSTHISPENATTVPVTFINSPMAGKSPEELQKRDEVHVRVLGSAVQKLPEHMIDPEQNDRSVPVQSWIETIDPKPSLPPDFDGNPKDYFKITTELDTGIFGEGLVYKNEKIKSEEPDSDMNLRQEEIFSLVTLVIFLFIVFLLLVMS